MRALELDFSDRPRRSSWQGAMLLLVGAISVIEALSSYDNLQREHALIGDEISQIERRERGLSAVAENVDEATTGEIERANSIIDQLALPWDRLFRAVEAAAIDKVVLVGITPDARAGTAEIMGETTDREVMMNYVRELAQQPELSGVYLLSHQYEPRGGARPFRFTVTASWLAKRAN